MKFINKTLWIFFVLTAFIITGCSTTSSPSKKEEEQKQDGTTVEPAIKGEKIDMSTLKPLTEDSTKEEVFYYATALITNARHQEAETKLIELTQKHPELSGPYTNLGISYFHTQQHEKAINAFNQAIALKTNNAVAFDYLGRIEREAGRFDSAKANYLKAIEADPFYPQAQRNLGILLDLYLSQPKEALAHYTRYLKLIGKPDKQVTIWVKDLTNRLGKK